MYNTLAAQVFANVVFGINPFATTINRNAHDLIIFALIYCLQKSIKLHIFINQKVVWNTLKTIFQKRLLHYIKRVFVSNV